MKRIAPHTLKMPPATALHTIRFPEKEEVTSAADPEPVSSLPWTTPWRVIVTGPTLESVQQTNLVQNLNPPSKITDTSWIKPGRSSWRLVVTGKYYARLRCSEGLH